MRVDVLATALGLQVDHDASCPSVSPVHCAEEELPVHEHHVSLGWLRLTPRVSVGLGEGWQASLSLPFDLRSTSVHYTLLDGTPYNPPYASIHHRNELLSGPVDGAIQFGWVGRWPGGWIFAANGGSTIPLGQTEEDPYELTKAGQEHQHFQLGAGTFRPIIGFSLVKEGELWRGFAGIVGRLSLYENSKDYRASSVYSADVGVSRELGKRLDAKVALNLNHTTEDRWSDEPYPGLQALNAKLGLTTHLGLNWLLEGQGLILIADRTLGGTSGDVLSQTVSFTVGLSWRN